jgi:hypothetical protein
MAVIAITYALLTVVELWRGRGRGEGLSCPFRRLAAAAGAASASAGTQGETLPRKRSTSASAARFEATAVVVPPLLKQKLPDQAPPWPVLPARWRGNFYRRSSRRL